MMAIKLIPFDTEMVRAILEGRKTQTRLIAFKHDDLREFKSSAYPDGWWFGGYVFKSFDSFLRNPQSPRCRYAPGDILWVRETWTLNNITPCDPEWLYKADYDNSVKPYSDWMWRSSIHMPKRAARIFLHVRNVRLEHLYDLNEEDAIAEGFADSPAGTDSPLERYSAYWDRHIKRVDLREYGWDDNPWVWAIEFERCNKPEGWPD